MQESVDGNVELTIGGLTKRAAGFALRTVVIAVAMLAAFVIVAQLTAPAAAAAAVPEDQAGGLMLRMLAVVVVDALILGLVVTESRWRGLPLIIGLTVALYGVQTLMGQIEALVFLTPLGERFGAGSVPMLTMPPQQIKSNFLVGAARAAVGAPLAVVLFGKARRDEDGARIDLMQGMGVGQWALKLGAIVALYELLYFSFGYYVAWKDPAVLAFYQGTDPGSFVGQMRNVIGETPTLPVLQALRAVLWAAFTLPVVDMLEDRGWLGALLTGLLVAVPMNAPHIIPNAFMPAEVRMAHFVETTSSTFIFGVLLFWLLHRCHRSVRDLLGWSGGNERKQGQRASACH